MSKVPTPSDILGHNFRLLPEECQLLLITSVLGTSPTWLLQSFVHDTLVANPDASLVLVSFMNNFEYFRNSMKRAGIDLSLYTQKKRFAFVDGLSALFDGAGTESVKPQPPLLQSSARSVPTRAPSSLPARGPPGPSQAAAPTALAVTLDQSPTAISNRSQLSTIQAAIYQAMSSVSSSVKPVLVFDSLDFLLAGGELDVAQIEDMLYDLREQSSSTFLLLSSDPALTSQTTTTIESNHAAFVVSQAHVADVVVSLRLLDTGMARDVSGVLRVTTGGGGAGVEEKEMLYFAGDGGVKMFSRGTSSS